MAELKTKATAASVEDFISGIADEQKRKDCTEIAKMMQEATGEKPKMWGPAIIGFGNVHLKYASGRELDWFTIGFSPRKANIALYLGYDILQHKKTLEKLGNYKTGKSCLYISKLEETDTAVLKKLIGECLTVAMKLPVVQKKND